MVAAASGGRTDITEKFFAMEGSKLFHEYERHKNARIEQARGQVPLTSQSIKDAIEIIKAPDIVESIFTDKNNPFQAHSFALVKHDVQNGYFILVLETVGGKRNPNIIPGMILQVSENKWNNYVGQGKSIGEMIYENDADALAALTTNAENIKNRVTVAQFAADAATANTPRSPRSDNNISQDTSIVNTYSMQNAEEYSETRTISDVREDISTLGGDVSKAAAILRIVRGEGTAADAAAIQGDAVAERLVREYSDTEGDLVLDRLPESAREGYQTILADFEDKSAASAAFEEAFRAGYNGGELTTHEGLAALETVAYEYGQGAKNAVGTVTLPRGVTLSEEAYKKLSEMAKQLGTHIVVTEHARQNKNGTTRGTYKTIHGTSYSEIVVAYDAKIRGRNGEVISGERAAVIQVLGHEVTHRLQDTSPSQYARLVKFVESASESGDFARYMKRNRNNRAAAEGEMTADFVMNNLFIDEKIINRLTKTDGKLAQTVRHVLQWLKEKLGMADKDLDRAIDLWNQAYRAADIDKVSENGHNEIKNSRTQNNDDIIRSFDGTIRTVDGIELVPREYAIIRSGIKSGGAFMSADGKTGVYRSGLLGYDYFFKFDGQSITITDFAKETEKNGRISTTDRRYFDAEEYRRGTDQLYTSSNSNQTEGRSVSEVYERAPRSDGGRVVQPGVRNNRYDSGAVPQEEISKELTQEADSDKSAFSDVKRSFVSDDDGIDTNGENGYNESRKSRYRRNSNLDENGKLKYKSTIQWVYDAGLFDGQQARTFFSLVADIQKRKYKTYYTDANGDKIVEVDNMLVSFYNGYANPKIRRVIRLGAKYDYQFDIAKENFYVAARRGYSFEETIRYVEEIFGDGFVRIFESENSAYIQGVERSGKGTPRTENIGDYGNGNGRTTADTESGKTQITQEADSDESAFSDVQKSDSADDELTVLSRTEKERRRILGDVMDARIEEMRDGGEKFAPTLKQVGEIAKEIAAEGKLTVPQSEFRAKLKDTVAMMRDDFARKKVQPQTARALFDLGDMLDGSAAKNANALADVIYSIGALDRKADTVIDLWNKAYRAADIDKVSENGYNEIKYSRKKFWTPTFTQQEWDIITFTMENEIQNSNKYIDQYTKWCFAEKSGYAVFGVYGIGDGTEPTLLYSARGADARELSDYFDHYRGEEDADGNTNQPLELPRALQFIFNRDVHDTRKDTYARAERSDVGILEKSRKGKVLRRSDFRGRGENIDGTSTGRANGINTKADSNESAFSDVKRSFVPNDDGIDTNGENGYNESRKSRKENNHFNSALSRMQWARFYEYAETSEEVKIGRNIYFADADKYGKHRMVVFTMDENGKFEVKAAYQSISISRDAIAELEKVYGERDNRKFNERFFECRSRGKLQGFNSILGRYDGTTATRQEASLLVSKSGGSRTENAGRGRSTDYPIEISGRVGTNRITQEADSDESAFSDVKRSFVSDDDGIDTDGENGYNEAKDNPYRADLELRGERRNKPTTTREWSAFNRSFANKTSGMQKGEVRNIVIYTGENVYLVEADGYMQGYSKKKISIFADEYSIQIAIERHKNGTFQTSRRSYSGNGIVADEQRRNHRGDFSLENGKRTTGASVFYDSGTRNFDRTESPRQSDEYVADLASIKELVTALKKEFGIADTELNSARGKADSDESAFSDVQKSDSADDELTVLSRTEKERRRILGDVMDARIEEMRDGGEKFAPTLAQVGEIAKEIAADGKLTVPEAEFRAKLKDTVAMMRDDFARKKVQPQTARALFDLGDMLDGSAAKNANALVRTAGDVCLELGASYAGGFIGGMEMTTVGGLANYASNAGYAKASGLYFADENGRLDEESYNKLLTEAFNSKDENVLTYAKILSGKNERVTPAEAGLLYGMLSGTAAGEKLRLPKAENRMRQASYFTDENGRLDAESYNALLTEGYASKDEKVLQYAKKLGAKKDGVTPVEAGKLYDMLVSSQAADVRDSIPDFAKGIFDTVIKDFDDAPMAALAFKEAYGAGYDGGKLITHDASGFAEMERLAYEVGRDAREKENLDRTNQNRYNDQYTEEHDGRKVHLRDGGERADSTDPRKQISGMEESAGRDPGGQTQSRPRDRGAALLTLGKEVSTADLSIQGGATDDKLRTVTGGQTKAIRRAEALAARRGLKLTLFAGGNLTVNGGSVRGYIDGDRVFVRADHPHFTADQIMRHEVGHDRIAKGEIDLDAVRARLSARYTTEELREISSAYAEAYAMDGAGLTADEIFEEVVCDSLGDMNIFDDLASLGQKTGKVLSALKAAAEAEATAAADPGAKAKGKESRDEKERRRALRKGEMVNEFHGALTKDEWVAYYAKLQSPIYSNRLFDNGDIMYMSVGGKLLRLEMQKNGEFSITSAWCLLDDEIDIAQIRRQVSKMEDEHGNQAVEHWLSTFGEIDSGEKVFRSYNRNSGWDYSDGERSEKSSATHAGLSDRESGSNRKGVLEIHAENGDSASLKVKGDTSEETKADSDGSAFSDGKGSRDIASLENLHEINDELRAKVKRLEKQLQAQKAQSEELRGQLRRTVRKSVRAGDVEKLAHRLITGWKSELKVGEISPALQQIGDHIVNAEQLSYTELRDMALPIAKDIASSCWELANAEELKTFKKIKSYLKGMTLYIEPIYKSDVAGIGGADKFAEFCRHNFGRFTVSAKSGTPVDTVYMELHDAFPGYFPDDVINPADQLAHISGVFDDMQPIYENPNDQNFAGAVECCAADIIDGLLDEAVRQTPPTFADKAAAKVDEARRQTAKLRAEKNAHCLTSAI